MLYHVLNYNRKTGIAKVVDAALYGQPHIAPSSYHVSAFISPKNPFEIIEGMTYSFNPCNFNVDGCFIRAELDYENPLPH